MSEAETPAQAPVKPRRARWFEKLQRERRAPKKKCQRCGTVFKKTYKHAAEWKDRKYCSHPCYIAARDDRPRSEKAIRHAAAVRKWQAKNPHKLKAHDLLAKALRRGKVKRMPCETCGATENVHAHHKDYEKPLDVTWLCALHHFDDHSKAGDLVRDRNSPQMAFAFK